MPLRLLSILICMYLHFFLASCDDVAQQVVVHATQVIAVGSGKEDEDGKIVKPNLSVGDSVLYSRYAGTEFTAPDDKQYIVIRESDVLASVA